MLQYLVKVLISATVIVAVSELAKRNTLWAALLASLPLTSLLAFVWLHVEGAGAQRVAELADGILWMVLPSLLLFVLLPLLLRAGIGFWLALGLSSAATAAAYAATVRVVAYLGWHH